MDREQIDSWCEKGILALVLGILVIGPLALGAHGPTQFLVLQGLTVGVMALWVARIWWGESPKFLWPPICWAVLAFMAYAVARYFQADIEYVARIEMTRVLVYGFLFYAILNNLHRQESIQTITMTLLFLAMLISLYAGYQFLTKSKYVWNVDDSTYIGRGRGTFIYPNHLAGFLEMLLPLGLCYVLMGRMGHVLKVFLGYAAVVMLAGIGVTMSRGGWLVTGMELMVLCAILLTQRDFRLQGFALLAVLIVAGALVIPRVQMMRERVVHTVKSGKADDLRLAIWQPAVQMWQDHFWWGIGPAHFDSRFPEYRPVVVQLRPALVHNDYLNTLADWGLVGTILVAAAWLLLVWGIFSCWRAVRGGRDDFARKKSNKFALLVGGSVGLVGILLHSFLDFNMQLPANAILAVALMAMLSSQWRFATERFWFRAGTILKCVASLALLAGMVYLGSEGWRGANECRLLQRAERIGQPPHHYSYAYIEAMEKAFRAEPQNFATTYAIAECYRLKSWDGGDDYVASAHKAMEWYQRGMKLNPYDPYNWLNYGMCLDWTSSAASGAPEDSTSYYDRANVLDPNGYFTTANTAWHYVQTGDLAAARTWFERARELESSREEDKMTYQYLPIIERRLEESAEKEKPVTNR